MNYRDELYLNIVKKFYKKYHRTPKKDELIKLGVNYKYIKLKYGSVKLFYEKNKLPNASRNKTSLYVNRVYGKRFKRVPQIYYIYNKNKKELIDRGRYFDLYFDYIFELGGAFYTLKSAYVNKRAYKGLIILGDWQHKVYDLCNREWKLYLVAMYFLFDTDYYKCLQSDPVKVWQKNIVNRIENGEQKIEDYLGDISRFDDTIQYMKDFKAGKIILRDYDKFGSDVKRLKTQDEAQNYIKSYINERSGK